LSSGSNFDATTTKSPSRPVLSSLSDIRRLTQMAQYRGTDRHCSVGDCGSRHLPKARRRASAGRLNYPIKIECTLFASSTTPGR
jgi:hypothetical protein